MLYFRAIVSVFLMTVLFNCVAAVSNNFPHGCEVTGFGFDGSYLIVNPSGNQSFYLIQNRINTSIELQRYETEEVFMSPSLSAKLEPSNWAAFASDVAALHFQCFINENDTNKQVDCRDVLEICQYPRVKFALSNMGNYWVSTNKTQSEVINESANKGILLRW